MQATFAILAAMQFQWIIDQGDIERVQSFMGKWESDCFVRRRRERNLADRKQPVTREQFWGGVYACLLTTQQRSGPDKPVSKFISLDPSPLELGACEAQTDLNGYVTKTLSRFGGLRRWKVIGKELETNLPLIQGDAWAGVAERLEEVRRSQTAESERAAARFISGTFRGFGPKQSRNLLQYLALSRYEIPLDSRVTKWLRAFGFPLGLSAQLLGDGDYYEFLLDGIQEICRRANVWPCMLDAAIFASYDNGGWTDDMLVW